MGIRGCIDNMSRCQKICSVCWLVVVVVLAVMIPVTLCSIMPSMAQSNLNKGTIEITNSTVYMPSDLTAHPWVYQETHAIMHSNAPFAVTMKPFTQTMTAVDWRNMSWFGPSREVVIGQVVFPEVKLQKGTNHIHVKMNITVNNSNNKECQYNELLGWTCFFNYQLYAAQWGGPGLLKMTSDDARVKTMGITIPGKFHSTKYMTCSKIDSPEDPVNVSNIPACIESGGCTPLVASMKCDQVTEVLMCPEDPGDGSGYSCNATTTTTTAAPSSSSTTTSGDEQVSITV
jgi:hypothetical protein